MKKSTLIISLVLNILIFVFVVFAVIAMVLGFNFMGTASALSSLGVSALKYFTVDSNILMGLAALVYSCYAAKALIRKNYAMPAWLGKLQIASVSGVALTFVVTLCFLTAVYKNLIVLYCNSNLFLHLIVPLLSVISYIFFEPFGKVRFTDSLFSMTPMAAYAAFYIPNVFAHLQNGAPDFTYDWYHFLTLGVWSAPLVILVIFGMSYGIGLALWFGNKKIANKKI